MRVLHVLHQYLPDHVGGVELYVHGLAQSQQRTGHQVALFFRRSLDGRRLERDTQDGLAVYRAVHGRFTPSGRFLSSLRDPYLATSLKQVIQEIDPDIIHIHHLMGLPVSSLGTGDLPGVSVVTLHDYWWVCANAQLLTDYDGRVCDGPRHWLNCARCGLARAGAGRLWPLAPLAAPLFARRAAVLRRLGGRVAAWIAPTAFVRDWYAGHGLPADRIRVIRYGIELPPAAAVRRDRAAGPARHFAYIGGLASQKGVHLLLDAFNDLPAGATLTVAGDETAFPAYSAGLRRLAAHPGVRFAGRLDREGVWRTLAEADVLVVPSLWYETAALVVQEAFAAGVPVIAADHGALAERVRHEVDGLLIPPGDRPALHQAMRRLMDEPGLLDRLRAGIHPVMTMAEHGQQIDRAYRDLIAEAKP